MFQVLIDKPERKRVREDLFSVRPWSQWTFSSIRVSSESIDMDQVIRGPDPKTHDDESSSESDSDDDVLDASVHIENLTASEFYNRYVKRSSEECLAELNAPQRSPLWHKARSTAITASVFGSVLGVNPYSTPDQAIIDKLWGLFQGNEATVYGTLHEPDAAATFKVFLEDFFGSSFEDYDICEYGLLKSPNVPYLAVSPDGILFVKEPGSSKIAWYVLEYKCPFYGREATKHPYGKWPHNVPPQYLAQVEGVSGYLDHQKTFFERPLIGASKFASLGLKLEDHPRGSFFVAWTLQDTYVTFVPFDPAKFVTQLLPELNKVFFEKLLPAMVHKHHGRLQENSLIATKDLVFDTV